LASEYIRKGKWDLLRLEIKKTIRQKLGLTDEFIDNLVKNLKNQQEKLVSVLSQELVKLDENTLSFLLQKLGENLEKLPKEETNQKKISCLLSVIKNTRQVLEENEERLEVEKLFPRIEEKILFFLPEEEKLSSEPNKEIDQLE